MIHSLWQADTGLKDFYVGGDHWCWLFLSLNLPSMVSIVSLFQDIPHFHSKSICTIFLLYSLFPHPDPSSFPILPWNRYPYLCKRSHKMYHCTRWPHIPATRYRQLASAYESNQYSRIRSNGASKNRDTLLQSTAQKVPPQLLPPFHRKAIKYNSSSPYQLSSRLAEY